MRDPHELLGVTRAATEAEIKRAFRDKAKQCHPDTHPNDPVIAREFRDLVSAYHAALKRLQEKSAHGRKSFSEELARAKGDNVSSVPRENAQPSARPDMAWADADHVSVSAQAADQSHQTQENNAAKARSSKTVPSDTTSYLIPKVVRHFWQDTVIKRFGEAMRKKISSPPSRHRPHHANPQAGENIASDTRRPGIDQYYQIEVGFIEARTGSKKMLTLEDGRRINVKIAPETREAQVLRLEGMGLSGNTHRHTGDALITVKIVDDHYSERSGDDFFLRLPISLTEAVLGTEIVVPGLYRDNRVTIPPNSSSGTNLRLKGQGFAAHKRPTQHKQAAGAKTALFSHQNERGDQYVTLEIKLPPRPDKALLSFIQRWSRTADYEVRQNIGMGVLDNKTKSTHN